MNYIDTFARNSLSHDGGLSANAYSGTHSHSPDANAHLGKVIVPDAHLLFSGHYERAGADLVVSDPFHRVVVTDYFHNDKRPTLVSPDGAILDSRVVDSYTG